MKKLDVKCYWENVYHTKEFAQMSWYQKVPTDSLIFFQKMAIPKNARIIDVGGGDSYLVDYLLTTGYRNVSVLDIASKALEKAQKRLGQWADRVTWINADINLYQPTQTYDVWHDRATFHFLLEEGLVHRYVEQTRRALSTDGLLFIGTFSEKGQAHCSGLPVRQYAKEKLAEVFQPYFQEMDSFNTDHFTPSGKVQSYSFCTLRKKTE
ncbi:class I SAM-dependent methyltransferase [Negadavirga shengliensis]|uniref:Class I SAM-dependent methyltransferase n=1 Tax=Negadavirga shengliensis TaxID=1389218 RepID=A0ABV9SYL5_9BACT